MFCSKCGQEMADHATICENCGAPVNAQPEAPQVPEIHEKPENVLTGVVGAIIGALLGAGAIILLSQIGVVASLSGLVLAVCTLKGYELLGGKLSKRGIFICCLLMAVTPYIADRMDWAIVICREFASEGVTFGVAFAAVHDVIAEADMVGQYLWNLLLIYLFVVMGAFGTLKGLFKKK